MQFKVNGSTAAYFREWRKLHPNYRGRLYKNNPEEQAKERARRQFHQRLREHGKKPLQCRVCGEKKTSAHHPSYKEPFKVIWLCHRHHTDLHKLPDFDAGKLVIDYYPPIERKCKNCKIAIGKGFRFCRDCQRQKANKVRLAGYYRDKQKYYGYTKKWLAKRRVAKLKERRVTYPIGFSYSKRNKHWNSYLTVKKQYYYLGSFQEPTHAALAHDLWAIDLAGYHVKTNFPVVGHSTPQQ